MLKGRGERLTFNMTLTAQQQRGLFREGERIKREKVMTALVLSLPFLFSPLGRRGRPRYKPH